jgi:cell division control protein 7
MARARAQSRTAETLVHQDDMQEEEEIEERLDESADPLEESGRTMDDSSEEEVEDSVAEDIVRFEESFVGINKRYRLINRIGEGMCLLIGLAYAVCSMQAHNL